MMSELSAIGWISIGLLMLLFGVAGLVMKIKTKIAKKREESAIKGIAKVLHKLQEESMNEKRTIVMADELKPLAETMELAQIKVECYSRKDCTAAELFNVMLAHRTAKKAFWRKAAELHPETAESNWKVEFMNMQLVEC